MTGEMNEENNRGDTGELVSRARFALRLLLRVAVLPEAIYLRN